MQIEIRQYQTHDAAAAAAIWNEVVRGGAAFPQREELTEAFSMYSRRRTW